MSEGSHVNRFFLVFQESEDTLATIDDLLQDIDIKYLQASNVIYVKSLFEVNSIGLVNMIGQTIKEWNNLNLDSTNTIRIPVENVSEGNYILKIETDRTTLNKKIVIK